MNEIKELDTKDDLRQKELNNGGVKYLANKYIL